MFVGQHDASVAYEKLLFHRQTVAYYTQQNLTIFTKAKH